MVSRATGGGWEPTEDEWSYGQVGAGGALGEGEPCKTAKKTRV